MWSFILSQTTTDLVYNCFGHRYVAYNIQYWHINQYGKFQWRNGLSNKFIKWITFEQSLVSREREVWLTFRKMYLDFNYYRLSTIGWKMYLFNVDQFEWKILISIIQKWWLNIKKMVISCFKMKIDDDDQKEENQVKIFLQKSISITNIQNSIPFVCVPFLYNNDTQI